MCARVHVCARVGVRKELGVCVRPRTHMHVCECCDVREQKEWKRRCRGAYNKIKGSEERRRDREKCREIK